MEKAPTIEGASALDDYLEMLSQHLKRPEGHLERDRKGRIAQMLAGRTYSLRSGIEESHQETREVPEGSGREHKGSGRSEATFQHQSHLAPS